MFSAFILHFIVGLTTVTSILSQYTLTGPTSSAQGSTVTFICTTSPVQIAVIWKEFRSGSNKSNYLLTFNSAERRCLYSSGAPPSNYTFDCNSTGVFGLSFPIDYSRHRGSAFQCVDAAGSGESNNITLSVTVPLTSVNLNIANTSPLTVVNGTNVTLVCETNPTDPKSRISWRRDGQSVSEGVNSSTRQETEGVVTVSVWSQRVQWKDRGIYSCEAHNSGVNRTSQDLTLNVQIPVSYITLTNITSNNQSVPVNQDSSLVLTCQTSPAYPAPTVTWYVRSSIASSGVDNRTENQTNGQIVTVSTMTRTMRKNNDQDTIYCRAENINGEAGTQSKTARANVFYGPNAAMVNLTKPAIIAERNDVTLNCSTLTPINPEVDFIWSWGDNTTITAGVGNRQGTARGSWSQTLTVRAVRDSNRQEIRCDVINTQTTRSERVVVDLDVSYGPDSGEVQVSKSSTAIELEPLSLTCSTSNNVKPGVSFNWTVDGSEVPNGTEFIQGSSGGKWSETVTLTPNRNQSSVECTVINTLITRQENSSVDLNVNYPPDISLPPVKGQQNTNLTLNCTATGNPSNYGFEDFRQYWADQLIQRRGGTQTGDRYSLDLPQVSYQDSGVYVCTVGNNVKQPSHKNTTVTVESIPVYTKDTNLTEPVGAEVGQNVTLVQCVYCSPNFTSIDWNLNTTNTTNTTSTTTTTPRTLSTDSYTDIIYSPVHIDVYGTQVEVAGFKLVYTVTNFQQQHVGLYTVRVCNIVGCAESTHNLVVSGPPETPLHFTAPSSSTNSVTLTWTPQYAGGDYTQEFHVEFRVQNTSGNWSSRVFSLSQDKSGAGVVDGLDSNTGYVFRIKSVTDRKTGNNQSPVSEEIYVTTKERKVPVGSAMPIGGIAGGIVGGLVFFILVAVLWVFWRRWKQNKGEDRERLGSNGRNGEIVMSGVGGAEDRATENAGVTYAEVKKKKKTVTDVYTEVKKPNKRRQKKDDVYENAVPRQDGDDANKYANAGFVGDEPEAKNENPQPPTGRDADGCLYVGIDFGNKKPGKVIIGKEKGSYVDIAYGKVGPPPPPDEDEEDKEKMK